MEEMQKIQKTLIWKNVTPKFKHEILCNSLEESGLKMLT